MSVASASLTASLTVSLNAPGRSTRGARCALRLAHGVRSPPVLTPKRRSRFEPPLTLFAETSPAVTRTLRVLVGSRELALVNVVERPAPFSPTPARVSFHRSPGCPGVPSRVGCRVVALVFDRCDDHASPYSPPRGGDTRGTPCGRSTPCSRLAPFASRDSLRSSLASLAPSRCASSQVWLRLRPSRAFAFQPSVPLARGNAPPSRSARPRAHDSRPGHGPAVRAGPRTTLALAAQVPTRGARGWFFHS